jgi:hypothetical protein
MSPRRWGEGLKLAKAHAILNGRDVVTEDDLRVYTRVLLNHPDDRKVARDLCKGFRDKLSVAAEEARAAVDALKASLAGEHQKKADGQTLDFAVLTNASKQIGAIRRKIEESMAANGGRTNPELDRCVSELEAEESFMQKAVLGR